MKKQYTLVEVIFALGLLMLLATCFFSSLQTLRSMDRLFTLENRAVMVLDNTLERLESCPVIDKKKVETVFEDEYAKSCLNNCTDIKAVCQRKKNILLLYISKKNRKKLAEIKVKCEN